MQQKNIQVYNGSREKTGILEESTPLTKTLNLIFRPSKQIHHQAYQYYVFHRLLIHQKMSATRLAAKERFSFNRANSAKRCGEVGHSTTHILPRYRRPWIYNILKKSCNFEKFLEDSEESELCR